LHQAQSENLAPIDLISTLVSDELACRSKRLLERRHKQAQFRDAEKRLDNFDFQFNPKMNRSLVFDLATAGWVGRREDALFLGPPGSGKSHCAQAIGHAVIQQGYRVLYREAHALLEELADATLDGKRKEHMELLTTVPLLIICRHCQVANCPYGFPTSGRSVTLLAAKAFRIQPRRPHRR
jgi:DNA replication protein DnaC